MRKLLGVALPSALLAVLITAACDVGAPVDSELLPNFATSGDPLGCPTAFTMFKVAEIGTPPDRNKDGLACFKPLPTRPPEFLYRQVEIDNNLPGGVGG